ncbi:MAG: flavodoxin [Spirochaetales bacterium]|nr:flavodoxin [Spirochaetales bacterium]
MKRILFLVLSLFSLGARMELNAQNQAGTKKILVAYFSQTGNTRELARQIQRQTGGDLFEIECAVPYPRNYDAFVEQAQQEQRQRARPALKTRVPDMEKYDIIFLGHPIWWSSIPMPVASFLAEYDLSGKTIIPFCSHGGGGPGRSRSVIAELAPRAALAETLALRASGGASLPEAISAWLRKNGVREQ